MNKDLPSSFSLKLLGSGDSEIRKILLLRHLHKGSVNMTKTKKMGAFIPNSKGFFFLNKSNDINEINLQ